MQITTENLKTRKILQQFGSTTWQTRFMIRSPQCRLFNAVKDINLLFVLAHLTELRKFTGLNNISVTLSKIEGGTQVSALMIGHVLGEGEANLIHYLHMGLISVGGELTTESNGKGTRYFFGNDDFHKEHFNSAILGTRITAIVPRSESLLLDR